MNQIDLEGRKAVITGGAQAIGFSSAERVRSGTTAALEKHGRIDILVANAGIAGHNWRCFRSQRWTSSILESRKRR